MQPLVPKIRVGEVLRGTRNLRHWLRTASILYNLERLHGNGLSFLDPSLGKNLYAPQKDDSFIVAANTPFHFCVWSPRQSITLIFMNPTGRHVRDTEPHMNPSLFATWFVRTNEYNLDLSKWPHFAYFIWGMVQMNALALPGQGYNLNVGRHYVTPFRFHTDLNNPELRNTVAGFVHRTGMWGRLRPSTFKACHTRRYGVDNVGYGPRLQHMQSMQTNIREYLFHARKFLGPRNRLANGAFEKVLLEGLQRYKEDPASVIELALKAHL